MEGKCPLTIKQKVSHPVYGELEVPLYRCESQFQFMAFIYATKERMLRFETPDHKKAIEIMMSEEDTKWLAERMLEEHQGPEIIK